MENDIQRNGGAAVTTSDGGTITWEELEEAFAGELAKLLNERGTHAEAVAVRKNNGVIRHGVQVGLPGEGGGAVPVFYVDGMPGRMSASEAADEIAARAEDAAEGKAGDLEAFRAAISSFETARPLIQPVFVKEEGNEKMLAECPRSETPFEGIAEIYYVTASTASGGRIGARVTDEIARRWGASAEDIREAAGENRGPAHVSMLTDVLKAHGVEGAPEPPGMPGMVVITSQDGVRGASCVLCDGVLERVSGMLGGSFLLIPSSVHEFIAAGGGADDMEAVAGIIRECNLTVCGPEDVLSDRAYLYDAESGSITAAEA